MISQREALAFLIAALVGDILLFLINLATRVHRARRGRTPCNVLPLLGGALAPIPLFLADTSLLGQEGYGVLRIFESVAFSILFVLLSAFLVSVLPVLVNRKLGGE